MPTEIKCERMTIWDFDHCIDCKRFRVRRGKGLNNWGCAHNESSAKEKSDFGMIWALAYLQNHGYNINVPEVIINYIGKRRRKS